MTSDRPTLDPKLDVVFNFLFGAERNRHLLIALLHSVLQPATPIASVEVLPPRPDVETIDEKAIFLDLRVRLESGELIDVEMQNRRHPALRERILFYWARLYTSQLHQHHRYPVLQRCVVILIASFIELEDPEFHSIFQVIKQGRPRLFSDNLELHLLELPKLRELLADDEPALAGWCRFLAADTDQQRETLAMQNPILKEAKHALDDLSADEHVREIAIRRELDLRLVEQDREVARQEGLGEGHQRGLAAGRQEGIQEGLTKGQRGSVTKLLSLKFGTLPAETEERIRNATEASLERWFERAVTATTLEEIFR